MSSPPPDNPFGATTSDQLMMQEILDLLATDSPTNNQDGSTASATASSRSYNDSSSNRSMNLGPADYTDSGIVDRLSGSFTGGGMQDIEDLESINLSTVGSLEPAAVGQAPPPPMNLGQPSTFAARPQLAYEAQVAAAMAATMASQDAESKPQAVPTPPLPLRPSTSSAPGTSHVLPTGQRIHVMNEAEFDELRRKLRAKTSSCRYRKRKKEETRKKKKKIQELKAELARLQDIEKQAKQYEERPLEDLEAELAKHKQEVAELSVKIGEAAQEELDWIRTMSSRLPK